MSDPGPLFPCSWTPSFEIARGRIPVRVPEGLPQGLLQSRPEYNKGHVATLLAHILKVSAPVFDRSTEEGLRFRIYRIGSLDVRTTQEVGGEEEIGVVFSIGARSGGSHRDKCLQEEGEVTKITEYVEASLEASSLQLQCQYYLVLETCSGKKIVTERLREGRVTWEQDPHDLHDRNSLAKVTRCSECCQGLTVREMLLYRASANEQIETAGAGSASAAECRRYAQATFEGVRAQEEQIQLPSLHELAREMRLSLQEESLVQSTVKAEEPRTVVSLADDSVDPVAIVSFSDDAVELGAAVSFDDDDAELAD